MLLCLGISILFGHAEVHHVDDISSFCVWSTNKEVVRFDVSVDEVLFVDSLDTRKLH